MSSRVRSQDSSTLIQILGATILGGLAAATAIYSVDAIRRRYADSAKDKASKSLAGFQDQNQNRNRIPGVRPDDVVMPGTALC